MIAILFLLLAGPARAGAGDVRAAVQRQEAVVDALAADVAAARAAGASRQELGARMGQYRAEAVRLAELAEPLSRSDADAERLAHAEAVRRLVDALANDRVDDPSRAALVVWLGDPATRVGVFDTVRAQTAAASDPLVRRALALDLAEQAGAMAILCRYDGAKASRDASRASAQAAALRARTAPGQSGGLDLVVAAERAEREALAAEAVAASAAALAARYETLRVAALTLSEGAP